MEQWWKSLEMLQIVFFCIAAPSIIVMIIQTILAMIGADADIDADVDVDFALDGVDFFTIRGFVAFFAIGGTVGFFVAANPELWWLAILLSIICGTLALVGMGYLIKAIMKLQDEGNVKKENAIGKEATVYIPIPAKRSGSGKINVLVQERYAEFDAETSGDTIETGANVKIVDIKNGVVIVERLKEE